MSDAAINRSGWAAASALLGEGPIESVPPYLSFAVEKLGEVLLRRRDLLGTDAMFLDDLHVVLMGLSRAAKTDDPDSPYRLDFVRSPKPANRQKRARREHIAAELVEDLVAAGRDTESAVAYAMETGLSRAAIFARLKDRKENGLAEISRKIRENRGPASD